MTCAAWADHRHHEFDCPRTIASHNHNETVLYRVGFIRFISRHHRPSNELVRRR